MVCFGRFAAEFDRGSREGGRGKSGGVGGTVRGGGVEEETGSGADSTAQGGWIRTTGVHPTTRPSQFFTFSNLKRLN